MTADDAFDILYEPNVVFSQFLGSASVTFFFSFPLLAASSCPAFSCFSSLWFYFLSFYVFVLRFLLFSFLFSLVICSSYYFSNRLASVVRMRSDGYYV